MTLTREQLIESYVNALNEARTWFCIVSERLSERLGNEDWQTTAFFARQHAESGIKNIDDFLLVVSTQPQPSIWKKYPEEKPKDGAIVLANYAGSKALQDYNNPRRDFNLFEYANGKFRREKIDFIVDYWCYEKDLLSSITTPETKEK